MVFGLKSPRREIRLKGGFTTRILYECEEFLLAEKPEGLPVHETKDPNRKDFTRLLASYLNFPDLRTANRLDLGTSGIVLLGKTSDKNSEIDTLLKDADKEYIFYAQAFPIGKKNDLNVLFGMETKKYKLCVVGGKKPLQSLQLFPTIQKKIVLSEWQKF